MILLWPKRPPDLSDDAGLADKGDEDEKASQQIQAVNQPGKGRYEVTKRNKLASLKIRLTVTRVKSRATSIAKKRELTKYE